LSRFEAYKLLAACATQPLAWLALLLAVGTLLLLRGRLVAGRRWVVAALLCLLLLGWLPLPDRLVHALETLHAPAERGAGVAAFAGVVVLGGSFEAAGLQQGRAQPQLNARADRLTEAVALALAHPALPVVFTGGCVDTGSGCLAEAALAQRFFTSMALPPERVRYEAAARTTHENALFTAQLPGLDASQPWLLLTSAWHMPRAVAAFRAQGWNVTPWPADFRSSTEVNWTAYSLSAGVQQWQLLLHEGLGLLAYWVAGRARLG
jgi:uncharacterized SAM-binding protein YcdF (DUF218 family)